MVQFTPNQQRNRPPSEGPGAYDFEALTRALTPTPHDRQQSGDFGLPRPFYTPLFNILKGPHHIGRHHIPRWLRPTGYPMLFLMPWVFLHVAGLLVPAIAHHCDRVLQLYMGFPVSASSSVLS